MATSMNISLPENLRDFVKARVKDEAHGTVSTYMRKLIIDDRKRAAQEKLDQLIYEGLSSESVEMTETDWENMKSRVKQRAKLKKPAK